MMDKILFIILCFNYFSGRKNTHFYSNIYPGKLVNLSKITIFVNCIDNLFELEMTDIPKCPKCGSEYTYFDGSLYVCPDCSHEFDYVEETAEADDVARDSNGAELFDGDAVTVIKDLKVKGSSMVIKRGTKVKSIRLTENPEEVDCKIDGSSIVLKTCFLKK